MREKILFVGLTVLSVLPMFGQEYFVNKSTSNLDLFDLGLDEHKDLIGGEIIDCIPDRFRSMGAERRNDEYNVFFSGELDGSEILVNVRDLSIRNSDRFLQSDVSKYWVHDYYFAAISSGSIQNAILKYESHWKDWVGTAEYQEYWTWADDFEPHAYFISDMSLFINSVNNFAEAYILFSSLRKRGNRFEAGIKEFYDYERNPQFEELLYIDDASKLQFSFDGDYLTIFLDEKEKVRLVGCDKEMFNFIRDCVKANECDLSKVTWPRHADGMCDYEDENGNVKTGASEDLDTSVTAVIPKPSPDLGKTAVVTENLRLRTDDKTTAKVVTTLVAGARVKVFAPGREDTIDGIASNWVQVSVLDGAKDKDGNAIEAGTVGWLFGGYLSEAESAESESLNKEVANVKESSALPIVPIATGGAVLAVLLAVVILVAKRKKSGKE